MRKVNLLMILLSGIVLSFSGWTSATSPEAEGDMEVYRKKMYAATNQNAQLTAQNVQLTAELERAKEVAEIAELKRQLEVSREQAARLAAENARLEAEKVAEQAKQQAREHEQKAAILEAEKKQLEEKARHEEEIRLAEEAKLPKTWEAIPFEAVKIVAWNQFYSEIEKKFDPRHRSDLSAKVRKAAELAKKNMGENYRPLISKINMNPSILSQPLSNWPKTKALNDASPEQVVCFLLGKIWPIFYGGKVGFTL